MPKMHTDRLVDGSLRFWSNEIGLGTIVAAAGWSIDHLHLRGDILNAQGRRATRHYAATKAVALKLDEDVSAWLSAMTNQIRHQDDLVAGLSSGRIEGVAWLAVFGSDVQLLPTVSDSIIAQLTKWNIKILIENYTEIDEGGLPRRTWLALARRGTSTSI